MLQSTSLMLSNPQLSRHRLSNVSHGAERNGLVDLEFGWEAQDNWWLSNGHLNRENDDPLEMAPDFQTPKFVGYFFYYDISPKKMPESHVWLLGYYFSIFFFGLLYHEPR